MRAESRNSATSLSRTVVRQQYQHLTKISTDKYERLSRFFRKNTCFPIGKFVLLTKIVNEAKL